MKPFYEIVHRPLVTEKSVSERSLSRYHFEVEMQATKPAIREAVEKFFKVKVIDVKTMKVPGKKRRFGRHVGYKPSWKKAVVTLAEGQTIKALEAE